MTTYNSKTYASWNALPWIIWDRFIIGWYNIHNLWLKTWIFVIDKYDWFKTSLRWFDFPNDDWKGYISNYFRWRSIKLKVLVRWENETEFNKKLDEVRKFVAKNQVYLEEKVNDSYRRIMVNIISCPIDKKYYNVTFLEFTIEFTALEPFWYDRDNTTISFLSVTSNLQEEITNEWTADIYPKINLGFTSASWTENVSVKIWDTEISINETIQNNDILIFDCLNKSVLLNNTEIDYNWTFPKMEVWTNIINFTIDWTFEADINILYKKTYK